MGNNKRFDNLNDLMYLNGGDLQITCRNPKCRAQLIVKPWRVVDRFQAIGKPLIGTSFSSVSERLRCQWCGTKHPQVCATMKTR